MQSASSKIWTRVAVSISYDDNHYTTGTSLFYNRFKLVVFEWNLTDIISSLIFISYELVISSFSLCLQ